MLYLGLLIGAMFGASVGFVVAAAFITGRMSNEIKWLEVKWLETPDGPGLWWYADKGSDDPDVLSGVLKVAQRVDYTLASTLVVVDKSLRNVPVDIYNGLWHKATPPELPEVRDD